VAPRESPGPSYRLLVLLLERPGEIVTREEVRQRLWPENTFVEFDNSLGVASEKCGTHLTMMRHAGATLKPFRAADTVRGPDHSFGTRSIARLTAAGRLGKERVFGPTSNGMIEAAPSHNRREYWLTAALVLRFSWAARSTHSGRDSSPSRQKRKPPVQELRCGSVARGCPWLRNLPVTGRQLVVSSLCRNVNTELAANGTLRMVPGEDVARVKRELPLPDEDSLAKEPCSAANQPGADVVVSVRILAFGQRRQTHPARCTRAG